MNDLLDRILAFENMRTAWEHVRTRGQTPGVDDWSARRFGPTVAAEPKHNRVAVEMPLKPDAGLKQRRGCGCDESGVALVEIPLNPDAGLEHLRGAGWPSGDQAAQ